MRKLPGLYNQRPPSADTNTAGVMSEKMAAWGRKMPSSIKSAARRALTWGHMRSPMSRGRTISHRPVPTKLLPADTDVSDSVVVPLTSSRRCPKLDTIPTLPVMSDGKFYTIFDRKVKLCMEDYDWHSQDARDIENKSVVLGNMNEILQLSRSTDAPKLTADALRSLLDLIDKHVFGVSLDVPALMTYSAELLSPNNPAMIFNSKCIELLENLMVAFPAEPSLSPETVFSKLFSHIDNPDMTERTKIAMLLSRVCKANPQLKEMACQRLERVFQEYIDGHLLPYGLGPGLQIFSDLARYGWIEMEDYMRMLLPLLATKHYYFFHRQFLAITNFFLDTRGKPVANSVIKAVMKVFPLTNSPKAVAFVQILRTVIGKFPMSATETLTVPFVKLLIQCTCCEYFRLSMTAFGLWSLPGMHQFLRDHTRALYPLIALEIRDAQESHWSLDVIKRCKNLESLLVVLDSEAFNSAVDECNRTQRSDMAMRDWVELAKVACSNDESIVLKDKIQEIHETLSPPECGEYLVSYSAGPTGKYAQMQRSPSLDPSQTLHKLLL